MKSGKAFGIVHFFIIISILVLFAGCKSGSSGDDSADNSQAQGSGENNDDNIGDTSSGIDYFYPLTLGSTWEYSTKNKSADASTYSMTIVSRSGNTAVMENNITSNSNNKGSSKYTYTNNYSVISLSKFESSYEYTYEDSNFITNSVTTYSPSVLSMVTSLDIGHIDTLTSIGKSSSTCTYDNGQTYTSAPVSNTGTYIYEVLDFETVTVPAGTFENALKIKTTIISTSSSSISISWFAKGIGCVKGMTEDGEVVTELIDYEIK